MIDAENICFPCKKREEKIELEALLTEREGMLAENVHRLDCGHSIAYGDDAFFELAERMRKLNKAITEIEWIELAEKYEKKAQAHYAKGGVFLAQMYEEQATVCHKNATHSAIKEEQG